MRPGLGKPHTACYREQMSVGFKEWALICEALGTGRQSIILRKGGIAEGREGFRFEHADFLLFPTLFHEQVQKLKLPPSTPLPELNPNRHALRWAARVEWTRELSNWEVIQSLDPHHLWQPGVIRERYEYEDKHSISLAFLRVFEMAVPLEFDHEPKYGGCRSWVKIPEASPAVSKTPVLPEQTHKTLEAKLLELLS